VELLDFAGPLEVFSSARDETESRERLLDVVTVAESLEPIECNNPLTVMAQATLDDCPVADILVVPGGRGVSSAMERPAVIEWISHRAAAAELTTSVCTGSFLLAKAGLLDGKPTTTYWASVEMMRETFPGLEVLADRRWVESGSVICSAGVSAGIDMSLHILSKLYGPDVARSTARNIEYDHWKE
jgi:transcriptional regulator GlxA family with amidase domain